MRKHAKVLGVAIATALALGALVGAGSAAASARVCSTSGTGEACAGSHGKIYSGPIKATLTATTNTTEVHAMFQSNFTTTTCTGSTMEGEVTYGTAGTGVVTSLTFSGCRSSGSSTNNCTFDSNASTTTPWPATWTASGKSDGNGSMDVSNITLHYACVIFGSTVNCYYTAASVNFDVFGSDTTPTIEATAVPLVRESPSSSFCSEKATWTGRYSIETPSSLFLT